MKQQTITVNWDDFEAAFFVGSPDARYFLSTKTGEVQYTSHMDDHTVRDRILSQTATDEWIELPRATSVDGLNDIEAFINAESDLEIQTKLRHSLNETNPFVAFNKAMGSDQELRKRWAVMRMRGIHKRLLAFCADTNLNIDDPRFEEIKQALSS